MNIPDPEKALRYPHLAIWHEGMQGQTGWYELTLNCGHKTHCSLGMLSPRILCLDCFRKLMEDA